jgi:hypothetical protein
MNDLELLRTHQQSLLEWRAIDRALHISLALMLLLMGGGTLALIAC